MPDREDGKGIRPYYLHELIPMLQKIQAEHGGKIEVWTGGRDVGYEYNTDFHGPVLCEPMVQNRKEIEQNWDSENPVAVLLWGDFC